MFEDTITVNGKIQVLRRDAKGVFHYVPVSTYTRQPPQVAGARYGAAIMAQGATGGRRFHPSSR